MYGEVAQFWYHTVARRVVLHLPQFIVVFYDMLRYL